MLLSLARRLLSAPSRLCRRRRRVREFAAAGLLDGLGGVARARRIRVLLHLADHGANVAALTEATRRGQLGYLLFDDALTPRGVTYTIEQISGRTGLSRSDVERWFRSMGRGVSTAGAADYSEDDLRLARLLAEYRALGGADADLFAFARIVGRNTATLAGATVSLIQRQLDADADHPEMALRYARELRRFAEFQSRLLGRAVTTRLRQYLRQQIHADTVDHRDPGAHEVAVCFADLVGFTGLGEQLSPSELGELADRLDALTTDVVAPPVRFVKTVGDAVLLLSPDPTSLATVVLELLAAAHRQGLPPLHAGIAWGTAVRSAGDWIGRPLNRASRIASIAKPLEVLVDVAAMRRLDSAAVAAEPAGRYTLKGFAGEHELYRVHAVRRSPSETGLEHSP
ncbi:MULTISPECIES: adenylate/guanylate cyclase domain-containing protein [Rhodococcus]|uniref:Adenylate cyclase n=1 Tax=Rhodococcus aetherivorans TaxID=191292 RepID=A0ABQ0YIH6_9NOCA|nr:MULTISPECIES: adenylate/guanylate cyclase domain-containing protein [Rhodococcus]ETT26181.1 adenylate/guanylate cyclase [Rhodococcus rhodochrous ATCC 21198]MBC2587778.1 adenylate/guanylate cyclase domain-containing protein [Rhodococcus aetherivorans]NGP27963.1 adenylate/guanylate cyclase domain-containing protein [Rhodococcus aetherivorans]QRI78988.1 adenylate/guanylate cyclase domain-containing protein [Rhodococcus aetherivorans]QSE62211.1 adenylate/guanylate cyclase domain-containing prot